MGHHQQLARVAYKIAPIKEAIETAAYGMGIDGEHHKTWAIDKIVKDLTGEEYGNVVENFKADTGKEWGTGIEP